MILQQQLPAQPPSLSCPGVLDLVVQFPFHALLVLLCGLVVLLPLLLVGLVPLMRALRISKLWLLEIELPERKEQPKALAEAVEATEDGFDVRDKAVQTVAKNSSNARDELMTRFFGLPLGEARDKDWLDHLQAAKTLLAAGNASKQPGHYLGVAWRFWKMAAIDDAIAVAEDGLAHCAGATELHLSALKNNVAYFMAHRGLPADSERATSLAQEAYLARITTRHLGSALATRGYVAITYGKSRSEILTGIRDCTEGLLNGASLDLFFVHARRAEERAAELQEQAA